MCGIAGFSGKFNADLLDTMSKVLAHRGPDGQGTYFDEKSMVGLSHRRLAVIDLSDAASQPMIEPSTGAVLVFNGEIYNFQSIRERLVKEGAVFRSTSDTEVLLKLLVLKGTRAVDQVNGIFSFAFWEPATKKLTLSRDGFGVKPLYYATTPKGIIFSSEIKALISCNEVEKTIDTVAVANYCTYLWSPGKRTILSSVQKLEPGQTIEIVDGKLATSYSHSMLPVPNKSTYVDEDTAIKGVRRHVMEGVEAQLVSDVPLGGFLSGGVDSSVIMSCAKQLTDKQLTCFTIDNGNTNRQDGMVDDLPFAKLMADHLGYGLEIVKTSPNFINEIEEFVYHLDEPHADPAALNTYLIAKSAQEKGIKVLLSGTGGDDVFSGYRRHVAVNYQQFTKRLPRLLRKLLVIVARRIPENYTILRRTKKLLRYADMDGNMRLVSYLFWSDPALMAPLVNSNLVSKDMVAELVEPLLNLLEESFDNADDLSKMLALDQRFFLSDHNLTYTDKMSMACGVETRVPFLDLELVNFASKISPSTKQKGLEGKWVLKKAFERDLPSIIMRRPKTGFGSPLRQWMKGPMSEYLNSHLSYEKLVARGIFNAKEVRQLIDKDRAQLVDGAYSIFAVLMVEKWCQVFLGDS